MGHMRIGSFNINGARDQNKRVILSEFYEIIKIDIVMLEETHSDMSNEIERDLWFGRKIYTQSWFTSSGVAVLFSNILNVEIFKI